jgi:ribosome-interacting GTPase 1
MPANLTPEYFKAEKWYREAVTNEEKILAVERMLAVMPKHKGTDHLKADLRAKVAKLTDELERSAGARGGRPSPFAIRREGAGQAVLVGPPNSGKSSLLAALTGAKAKVASYPFTTQVPEPGMLRFENTRVQVVDTPALSEARLESQLLGLLHNSDVLGPAPPTRWRLSLGYSVSGEWRPSGWASTRNLIGGRRRSGW